MPTHKQLMRAHRAALSNCRKCPEMIGPVVSGSPVLSPILLIGQAPGDKEGGFGKPFAWTAGKTMFKWFERIGLDEQTFRQRVYMAAVCRCFPGKNPKGGDRVPSQDEINNCVGWLQAEIDLLKPELILPIGKLAISQLMPVKKLNDESVNFILLFFTATAQKRSRYPIRLAHQLGIGLKRDSRCWSRH
jgi:uracil-DNA glycosylase